MSSITSVSAASSSSSVPSYPTAFGDKTYKELRVAVDYLYKHVIALLCEVISKCAGYCACPKAADKYRVLADYCSNRAKSRQETFDSYGDQLINFSWNGLRQTLEMPSKGVSEIEMLRRRYGEKTISDWLKFDKTGLLLQEKHLSLPDHGCCNGMSVEFIAKYLKGVKKGLAPLEAAKYAGYRYESGATEKAELFQMFNSAIYKGCMPVWRGYNSMIDSYRAVRPSHTGRKKSLRFYRKFFENYDVVKNQILLRQMGLQSKKEIVFLHSDEEKEDEKLGKSISDLPDDAYQVSIPNPNSGASGHAISVIKNGDNWFILEPVLGTLALKLTKLIEVIRDSRRSMLEGESKPKKLEYKIRFTPMSLLCQQGSL